jgi:lauroyl/myristoyl acyltransferase
VTDGRGAAAAAGGPGPAFTAGGRSLRGSAIVAGTRLLSALPEGPLVAAAESLGELWYRASPGKAAQARANLGRVCAGLAAQGRGSSLVKRAATDPDALERIVRHAFRHAARYYLEVARAGNESPAEALARIDVETPDEVATALRSGEPVILTGMHYGAIEVPVVVVSDMVGHRVTAPMEIVGDPAVARWFESSRRRVGVNIVPINGARHTLLAALRRGESVGMVADRDLLHNGIPVPFFGHPAPLPAGPALLSVETGRPIYVGAARRMPHLRYRGKLVLVPAPVDGRLRQRVTAVMTSIAEIFESLLADGPEQWFGAFHPIWPDLVVGDPDGDAGGGGQAAGGSADGEPPASRREGAA